ncbi:hypothetical protein AAF712_013177 [Marasmius tenuissimus]|uniref:Uncharacterized protein n=1 Tax=Marasmius tenuissimus TaxID=585030 RepID=A0ABR2ZGD4_9AGAR
MMPSPPPTDFNFVPVAEYPAINHISEHFMYHKTSVNQQTQTMQHGTSSATQQSAELETMPQYDMELADQQIWQPVMNDHFVPHFYQQPSSFMPSPTPSASLPRQLEAHTANHVDM